jgi:hypothetical protein
MAKHSGDGGVPELPKPVVFATRPVAASSQFKELEERYKGGSAPAWYDAWLDLQERQPQDMLASIVRAAGALLTVLSILVGVHLAALGFRPGEKTIRLVSAEAFWGGATLLVWMALRPTKWHWNANQIEGPGGIKEQYLKMAGGKEWAVKWAAVLTLAGLVAAVETW